LIGIASAVAMLIGLARLRRIPAAPEVVPEATTKLDLTPSRMVPLCGALIIACAVLLYYVFF